jgi:hypothetical protein
MPEQQVSVAAIAASPTILMANLTAAPSSAFRASQMARWAPARHRWDQARDRSAGIVSVIRSTRRRRRARRQGRPRSAPAQCPGCRSSYPIGDPACPDASPMKCSPKTIGTRVTWPCSASVAYAYQVGCSPGRLFIFARKYWVSISQVSEGGTCALIGFPGDRSVTGWF